MRKLTRSAIWLFVFSVPWGIVEAVFGGTSITRFLGLAALGLGLLTVAAQRRVHKPGPIFWTAAAFVTFAMLSQVWSIAYATSSVQVFTYVQFLGLIWLMGEFVRTRGEHDALMVAFWCGALVLGVDVLWNFGAGGNLSRYTATGFNPNYVGFALVVGFPMALRRFSTPGFLRALAGAYCVVAPIVLLLTASRSSILAGSVVLTSVLLERRRSVSSLAAIAGVAVLAVFAIVALVPGQTWERVLSTKADIETGYLGGRGDIWNAGWTVFLEQPALGSGIGTFPTAIAPVFEPKAGHNTVLTLLVELGVVGLALFALLVVVCIWTIASLRPPDRTLWAILTASWLILAMAHDSHGDKVTWVLIALLAAQRGLSPVRVRAAAEAPTRAPIGEPLVPFARRI